MQSLDQISGIVNKYYRVVRIGAMVIGGVGTGGALLFYYMTIQPTTVKIDALVAELNKLEGRTDSLQANLTSRFNALDGQIQSIESGLNTRISAMETRIDSRSNATDARLDSQFHALLKLLMAIDKTIKVHQPDSHAAAGKTYSLMLAALEGYSSGE